MLCLFIFGIHHQYPMFHGLTDALQTHDYYDADVLHTHSIYAEPSFPSDDLSQQKEDLPFSPLLSDKHPHTPDLQHRMTGTHACSCSRLICTFIPGFNSDNYIMSGILYYRPRTTRLVKQSLHTSCDLSPPSSSSETPSVRQVPSHYIQYTLAAARATGRPLVFLSLLDISSY